MGRLLAATIASAMLLSGCAPAVLIYHETRKVSKERTIAILAETVPEADREIQAECIMKGMTYGEVLGMGNSDPVRALPQHRALIAEVAKRPAVVECVAAAAKPVKQ
jgi:hypothetical protein